MRNIYYYEIKKDATLCIHRVFGESGKIIIPSSIDNKIVSEIGEYCFAQKNQDYTKYRCSGNIDSYVLKEQGGKDIEEIILPETIHKIGNCAFYNCRYLKQLTMPNIKSIGSDCFMNCLRLHDIYFLSNYEDTTILKQVLSLIIWDIDIHFKNNCTLFFPEYYLNYDEIGPAHIFGLNIEGEGFRCRQAFKDTVFQFEQYDQAFDKLSKEESEKVLNHFCLNRLLTPVHLHKIYQKQYEDYIVKHAYNAYVSILKSDLSNKEKIHIIEYSILHNYINEETLKNLIIQMNNVELSIEMNTLKSKYFKVHHTYEFEEW